MARRSTTKDKSTTTEEAVVTDTATEAAPEVAESTTTEAEATESTKAEKPAEAEVEIDLSDFQAAVATAIENKDESTGEVAVQFIEGVNKAYRELDGLKAKNAAKKVLTEGMTSFMKDGDMFTARAYLALQENLSAAAPGGGHRERTPVDPTGAYVDRQVTLDLARQLIVVPEGVDAATVSEKVAERYGELYQPTADYLAWLQDDSEDKGDEPEVGTVVKAAAKLALGKAARPGGRAASAHSTGQAYSGPRRSVTAHIESAFADVEPGTFLSVNDIRKHRSAEYGDDTPSAGAVSARLFPKSGKANLPEGISPTKDNGRLGAIKS